jgi:hypothetical protein
MKLTIFVVFAAACFLVVNAKPQFFNLDGFEGVVETSHQVNGVETSNIDPKMKAKAEEVIKSMIHKHLNKKKKDKKLAKQEKAKATVEAKTIEETQVEPKAPAVAALPTSINWNDHPEARDRINQRVPGGTASLDALIELLRERQTQS